jgi:hypothetical protein
MLRLALCCQGHVLCTRLEYQVLALYLLRLHCPDKNTYGHPGYQQVHPEADHVCSILALSHFVHDSDRVLPSGRAAHPSHVSHSRPRLHPSPAPMARSRSTTGPATPACAACKRSALACKQAVAMPKDTSRASEERGSRLRKGEKRYCCERERAKPIVAGVVAVSF